MNNSLRMIDNVIQIGDNNESSISMKYIPSQTDTNLVEKRMSLLRHSIDQQAENSVASQENTDKYTKYLEQFSAEMNDRITVIKTDDKVKWDTLRNQLYDSKVEPIPVKDGEITPVLNEADLYPNAIFAKDVEDYYGYMAKKDFISFHLPTDLNLDASLSIYGIAGINPGNLFRISYLPKKYRDNVFFQITGITHDISTSTWTTTIDSIMRIAPAHKSKNKWMVDQPSNVFISTKYIEKYAMGLPKLFGVFAGFSIVETALSITLRAVNGDTYIKKPTLVLQARSIKNAKENKSSIGTMKWRIKDDTIKHYDIDIVADRDHYIIISPDSVGLREDREQFSKPDIMIVDKTKSGDMTLNEILTILYSGTQKDLGKVVAGPGDDWM